MKNKKLIKVAAIIFLFLTVSSTLTAHATWYRSSSVDLPRNGWRYVIQRQSTRRVQNTSVTNPQREVITNIVRGGNDDRALSSNVTHRVQASRTVADHNTNVIGANTRAAYRSSVINQLGNRVDMIGFRP